MAVTNFIWDELSDNVLLETDESDALTARYTNRPEQFGRLISQYRIEDEKIVERFYHYDGESSTSALTDANENVTDTFIYTAYGEEVARTGTTTNPFGYKGAVGYYTNEETNDIYVRNRTYEPAMGCWLSADPIGFVDGTNLHRAYFVPNGIDATGLLCVFLGPAKYYECGNIIWRAQFHLDKLAERQGGGWLIQRIHSNYAVWNCEKTSFIGSAACGVFFTRDPDKQEQLVYWELVDMRRSAPNFNSPVDQWSLASTQFVGAKNFGFFRQEGSAWFHPGQARPLANWRNYPDSPSRGALLSCEAPAGEPDEGDYPVIRRLTADWDCCSDQSLEDQVCGGDVVNSPNGDPPYVLLHTEVQGECNEGN